MHRDLTKNLMFSVFNCAIPSGDLDSYEETLAGIIDASADVVCIHDIDYEETRYTLYEKLREFYGYFCLEERSNGSGGALIQLALKY